MIESRIIMKFTQEQITQWTQAHPQIEDVIQKNPVFWINQGFKPLEAANQLTEYSKEDINDAEARLNRFAPFIQAVFPETIPSKGIIESEITEIAGIQTQLAKDYQVKIPGNLFLKRDDTLPIAGTIKARGAIYEVLKHAEDLALEHGIIDSIDDNYEKLASDSARDFFSNYGIMVGTTGNLGISVGVMSAALGFNVTVHMSHDAKQWKKDLLRSRGVNVIEHQTNFTEAVTRGRLESEKDDSIYFVDDEHSVDLFLGYTVAGNRIKAQLDALNIQIDQEHPLFVYLPCGIGGSPGGITFGLKQMFGDHVYCFFGQPTQMPSMLLGLMTNEFDGVSVQDFDIEPKTIMDGLAVPRTSAIIAKILQYYFQGGYTLTDQEASHYLAKMIDIENISLEPASIASLLGPIRMLTSSQGQAWLKENDLVDKLDKTTHLAWATGGSMVPEQDMNIFYQEGINTTL